MLSPTISAPTLLSTAANELPLPYWLISLAGVFIEDMKRLPSLPRFMKICDEESVTVACLNTRGVVSLPAVLLLAAIGSIVLLFDADCSVVLLLAASSPVVLLSEADCRASIRDTNHLVAAGRAKLSSREVRELITVDW